MSEGSVVSEPLILVCRDSHTVALKRARCETPRSFPMKERVMPS